MTNEERKKIESRMDQLAAGVQLYLGDYRDHLPKIGRVDLIFADPPYLEGDFSEALPLFRKASSRIVVTPGKQESFNWIARRRPQWEYAWRGAQVSRGGRACMHIGFEPILSYGWPLVPLGTDVLTFPIENTKNNTGHPWPKPIALMEKIVEHWSRPGDVICDPFMGSGTTGAAALKLGRRFVGVEIEPKYFDIATQRLMEIINAPALPLDSSFRSTPPKPLITGSEHPNNEAGLVP